MRLFVRDFATRFAEQRKGFLKKSFLQNVVRNMKNFYMQKLVKIESWNAIKHVAPRGAALGILTPRA